MKFLFLDISNNSHKINWTDFFGRLLVSILCFFFFFFFFFLSCVEWLPCAINKNSSQAGLCWFHYCCWSLGLEVPVAFLCIYKSTSNKLDFCTCGTLTALAQMLPHPIRLEKLAHRQQQPHVAGPASQLAVLGIPCVSCPLPFSHVLQPNFPAFHEFLPINSGSLEKVWSKQL